MNAVEVKSLREMRYMRLYDRVKKTVIRERRDLQKDIGSLQK